MSVHSLSREKKLQCISVLFSSQNFSPARRKKYCYDEFPQQNVQETENYGYEHLTDISGPGKLEEEKDNEKEPSLTCLAIPKSASLTTPDESTSKLAPLMSLHTRNRQKKGKRECK